MEEDEELPYWLPQASEEPSSIMTCKLPYSFFSVNFVTINDNTSSDNIADKRLAN
jgi:hypothetical protein